MLCAVQFESVDLRVCCVLCRVRVESGVCVVCSAQSECGFACVLCAVQIEILERHLCCVQCRVRV